MFLIMIFIILFYVVLSIFYGYVETYNKNNKNNKNKKDKKVEKIKKDRIVVSLTTLPSRVGNLPSVIQSILNNKIKPDAIYINVPEISKREKTTYNIPKEIKNYKNSESKVIINTIKEDYGPATKLYPTLLLEKDPETIIICIDDDHYYDEYLIEHLLGGYQTYPNNCICVSGWNYLNLGIYALPLNIPINNFVKNVSILQCYNGVLYKRKFFQEDFIDFVKMKECLTTDDIMISKYLLSKNINIKSIPYNFKHKDIDNKAFKLGSTNLLNNNWIKCINKSLVS